MDEKIETLRNRHRLLQCNGTLKVKIVEALELHQDDTVAVHAAVLIPSQG